MCLRNTFQFDICMFDGPDQRLDCLSLNFAMTVGSMIFRRMASESMGTRHRDRRLCRFPSPSIDQFGHCLVDRPLVPRPRPHESPWPNCEWDTPVSQDSVLTSIMDYAVSATTKHMHHRLRANGLEHDRYLP